MPTSKKHYLIFSLLCVVIAAIVALLLYKPKPSESHAAYQMKTSSEKGEHSDRMGSLEFTNGLPVSNKMSTATLCVDDSNNIKNIDLYMPDMGHGSEPPLVKQFTEAIPATLKISEKPNFGCVTLENMQLFMAGLWQVRVFYNDGFIGIIDINLDK